MNTLEQHALNSETVELNEIALTSVKLTDQITLDRYVDLPQTGSFVVIDRYANVTVGAGIVNNTQANENLEQRAYCQAEVELNAYIRKNYPEWQCKEVR